MHCPVLRIHFKKIFNKFRKVFGFHFDLKNNKKKTEIKKERKFFSETRVNIKIEALMNSGRKHMKKSGKTTTFFSLSSLNKPMSIIVGLVGLGFICAHIVVKSSIRKLKLVMEGSNEASVT